MAARRNGLDWRGRPYNTKFAASASRKLIIDSSLVSFSAVHRLVMRLEEIKWKPSFTSGVAPRTTLRLTGCIREVIMWIRSCPHCKGELRKQHVFEMVRCICGWIWG
jgi:hypothetical protein